MSNNKVEKVSPEAMKAQSRQQMKKGHNELKKRLSEIDGSTYSKSANQALMEALNGFTENMGQQTAQDMYQGNYDQNPMAALAKQGMPYNTPGMSPVNHGDWQPQAILKETRIGKEVERYRVKNTSTGKTFNEVYRYQEVANQVAAFLNETNNPNDPRIKKLDEWAKKEESVLMETKKLVKKYKGLDEGNISRRTIVKNKIDQNKLILENVRLKMGVI